MDEKSKELDSLLGLARLSLEQEASNPELPDTIDRYSFALDTWFKQFNQELESGTGIALDPRLPDLLQLHQKVLDRAESLKDEAQQNLKTLKQKGKGFTAYGRTSAVSRGIMRPRKG